MRSKEEVMREFASYRPTEESSIYGMELYRFKREKLILEALSDIKDLLKEKW